MIRTHGRVAPDWDLRRTLYQLSRGKTLKLGVALHRGSVSASHPAALGLILGVPIIFSEKNLFDVAEINCQGTA